jgi:hypothetical protein
MASGFDHVLSQSQFQSSDGGVLEFLEIPERNRVVAEKAFPLKALGGKGRRF